MKITLPIPDSKLWPNSRTHWRVKAVKTRSARKTAYFEVRPWLNEWEGNIPPFTGYTLAFFYKDARRRDDDNAQASCKAYRDGIADALGVDDNTLRLAALPTFAIDRENPRVEITLLTNL